MKLKSVTAAIILALACVMVGLPSNTHGQRPRTGRKAKPAKSPAPVPTPTPIPLSALSIEAGLIYDNGDVKPVARTTFYLLDESLWSILKSIEVNLSGRTPMDRGSKLEWERAFNKNATYQNIKAAIEPHIVASAITDFGGKARFESLTPGTRFVYGEFSAGRSRLVWDTRVELRAGAEVTLTLDNNN